MLVIENLIVKYGLAEALKGISLEVEKGKIVAVLGNNGAGKTTLLRAISGLQPASISSLISFEGKNITQLKTQQIVKHGICHVPEGRQIFAKLSVEENMIMGAYLRKDKSEIAEDMTFCFDLFPRLKERISQTAGTLSGGEQQMLAIARALMGKPKFLMLDEPSMGIAPALVEKIYETILEINKTGLTLMIVEQNANIALEVCDYAYTMTNGVISNKGMPKQLLGDKDFLNAFLGNKK